jgi:hypothetical protein
LLEGQIELRKDRKRNNCQNRSDSVMTISWCDSSEEMISLPSDTNQSAECKQK